MTAAKTGITILAKTSKDIGKFQCCRSVPKISGRKRDSNILAKIVGGRNCISFVRFDSDTILRKLLMPWQILKGGMEARRRGGAHWIWK